MSRLRAPVRVLLGTLLLLGLIPVGIDLVGRLAIAEDLGREEAQTRPPGLHMALLAVGDTGKPARFGALDEQRSVGAAMTEESRIRPIDALVFLGDNFYYNGLRASAHVERIRENLVRPYCAFIELQGARSAAVADACPLPPAARLPVPLYAVLGNHDYGSPESPRLQAEVVPEYVSNWRLFPVADVVELPGGVSLVLYDSVRGTTEALVAALRRSRGPWRILAAHHPLAEVTIPNRALEQAGVPVQLQLAGHYHQLGVNTPEGTLVPLRVVSGGGSGPRRGDQPPLPAVRFERLVAGFARVELRSGEAGERLEVTLFEAPRYPFEFWRDARPVSAWSVDLAGRVREELPGRVLTPH